MPGSNQGQDRGQTVAIKVAAKRSLRLVTMFGLESNATALGRYILSQSPNCIWHAYCFLFFFLQQQALALPASSHHLHFFFSEHMSQLLPTCASLKREEEEALQTN